MKIRLHVLDTGTRVRIRQLRAGERGIWIVRGRVAGSGLTDPAYDLNHEPTGRPRVLRRSRLRLVRATALTRELTGTGKTSPCAWSPPPQPRRCGLYVAYNKAIATDAKHSFPPSVTCATAHSLTFRAVRRRFAHRLNGPACLPARRPKRWERPAAGGRSCAAACSPAGRPAGDGGRDPLLPFRRRSGRALACPQVARAG